MGELPGTRLIRNRIESVTKSPYRNALKFAWLGLCRASEVVGISYESDKRTKARGPKGNDFEVTEYRENGDTIETVLFSVRTSKRGGLERIAAYPLEKEYEPWAIELYDYFQEFDHNDIVFPFTRQKLWEISRETFTGLTYPIEEYNRIIEERELSSGMQIIRERGDEIIVKVPKHTRVLASHAIRHIRAVDLMTIYGFSVQELSIIGGWTLRSMTGASGAIARYAHLDWRSYFQKLLIKRY